VLPTLVLFDNIISRRFIIYMNEDEILFNILTEVLHSKDLSDTSKIYIIQKLDCKKTVVSEKVEVLDDIKPSINANGLSLQDTGIWMNM
jgi:hypothetical protein